MNFEISPFWNFEPI